MRRSGLRTAIVSTFVVGAFVAVFFGFLDHSGNSRSCGKCPPPPLLLVAKVSIPKGTSGRMIISKPLYSTTYVRWNQRVKGALFDPFEIRNEVAIRTIPAGARLATADFELRSPIYYPRGYPKSIPASETPAEMSHQLGPQSFSSDLALAPGVWVDGSPSEANLDLHVANGTLVGYCGAVRAFQAHNADIRFAMMCWRTPDSPPLVSWAMRMSNGRHYPP